MSETCTCPPGEKRLEDRCAFCLAEYESFRQNGSRVFMECRRTNKPLRDAVWLLNDYARHDDVLSRAVASLVIALRSRSNKRMTDDEVDEMTEAMRKVL